MAKQKTNTLNRLLAEFLFWLHFLIAVIILFLGLFMPWYWVVIVLVLLRVQQIVFHGCVVTLLEQREGGMPKGMVYYQLLFKRFFGYRLKRSSVKIVFLAHYAASLIIAILASYFNIRISF